MSSSPADEPPIFVTDTSRRRRLVLVGGTVAGVTLTLALLALVSGFTGSGAHQTPMWPVAGSAGAPSVATTVTPPDPAPASDTTAGPTNAPGTDPAATGAGHRAGAPGPGNAPSRRTRTP